MMSHEEISPLLAAYEMDLLTPDVHQEVEAHLAECDVCFEDAYSFSPAAEAMRAARSRQPSQRRMSKAGYALAAALVLAGFGVLIFRTMQPDTGGAVRGYQQLELLAPAARQQVAFPVEFRWTPVPAARLYRITVLSNANKLLDGVETTEPQYIWKTLSPPPSGVYLWKVEAFLPDGTRIASSSPREFLIP